MSTRPPPPASDGAVAERVVQLPTTDSIDLKEATRLRTDVSDAAIRRLLDDAPLIDVAWGDGGEVHVRFNRSRMGQIIAFACCWTLLATLVAVLIILYLTLDLARDVHLNAKFLIEHTNFTMLVDEMAHIATRGNEVMTQGNATMLGIREMIDEYSPLLNTSLTDLGGTASALHAYAASPVPLATIEFKVDGE